MGTRHLKRGVLHRLPSEVIYDALHRVTPVEGRVPRLLAVLSYDTAPDKMLTEHTRALFYGRVA